MWPPDIFWEMTINQQKNKKKKGERLSLLFHLCNDECFELNNTFLYFYTEHDDGCSPL